MKRVRFMLSVLALAAASTAAAQDTEPAFGMVGVAHGQSAVLTAVLTGALTREHPGCPTELSFVDAQGQVLHDRDGNEVKQTFVLRGHAAASLTLNADDILAVDEIRKLVRAVVADPPDQGAPGDCRGRKVSRETVDEFGVALTVLELEFSPHVGRNPPPPPPIEQ